MGAVASERFAARKTYSGDQGISLLDDQVILWRVSPRATTDDIERMSAQLARFEQRTRHHGVLLDLSAAPRLGPDERRAIRDAFAARGDRVFHLAVCHSGSLLASIVVQVLLASMKLKSSSVHRDFLEALDSLRGATCRYAERVRLGKGP